MRLFQDEAEYHRWSVSGIINDGLAKEVGDACDVFFKRRGMINTFKQAYNYYAKRKA